MNENVCRKPEPLTINLFDAYEQQKQLTLSMKRTIRLMDNSSMIVHASERSLPGQRLTTVPFKHGQRVDETPAVYWTLNEEVSLLS